MSNKRYLLYKHVGEGDNTILCEDGKYRSPSEMHMPPKSWGGHSPKMYKSRPAAERRAQKDSASIFFVCEED